MKTTVCAAALIMVTAVAGTVHGADTAPKACPLLTSAEIGAATGETIGQPRENAIVITEGPSKGETMGMCTWPAGGQGSVSVAVVRALQGAQREAGLAQFKRAFETLKAQGWSEERKEFSNGACALMTPPASAKGMPVSTGCFAEAKGMGISVGHNSSSKVSVDKMKTLLDKAIGRLP
jgi:hypothetical protein